MPDKLETSCLSITFLPAKNFGQVTNKLAARKRLQPFLSHI